MEFLNMFIGWCKMSLDRFKVLILCGFAISNLLLGHIKLVSKDEDILNYEYCKNKAIYISFFYLIIVFFLNASNSINTIDSKHIMRVLFFIIIMPLLSFKFVHIFTKIKHSIMKFEKTIFLLETLIFVLIIFVLFFYLFSSNKEYNSKILWFIICFAFIANSITTLSKKNDKEEKEI